MPKDEEGLTSSALDLHQKNSLQAGSYDDGSAHTTGRSLEFITAQDEQTLTSSQSAPTPTRWQRTRKTPGSLGKSYVTTDPKPHALLTSYVLLPFGRAVKSKDASF